jgi:uncharacterized protein (DUF305 family)
MTEEQLESDIHECQHGFATRMLVHEQGAIDMVPVCSNEV